MNTAIITAGGQGRRMQQSTAKQYLKLHGKSILEHSILAFQNHSSIDAIVLVLPQEDLQALCVSHWQDSKGFDKVVACVAGGDTRQASVYQGLKHVAKNSSRVLIHDAARCLIDLSQLEKALTLCEAIQGIVYANPVSDSLKKAEQTKITDTVERKNLWAMQTPQIFQFPFILDAHAHAEKTEMQATDDAALAIAFGGEVEVFESLTPNFKLTHAHDIPLFECLLGLKDKV